MATMNEGKMDVVVQVKREQGKKDGPPKMYTDLPASMTFQQLLERIVPDISQITAICRAGFKKRGEKIPTDFVEGQLNDCIGKLNVTESNFIEYCIKEDENDEEPPAKRSAFDVMMAASQIKELPPEISEKNSFDALYNQVLKVITSLNPMAGFNAGEIETTGTISIFCFLIQ